MSSMEYVSITGHSSMKGEWYEVKLSALLFLRSKNCKRVSRFQLGTNVEGAGALDDIIYRMLSVEDPHNWYTSFIQLKHKERTVLRVGSFTGPKGDFSLIKYLKSYNEIKKAKLEDGYKNSVFYEGSFDFFRFVIYTNSKVDAMLMKRKGFLEKLKDKSVERGDVDELLMSNFENELVFNFTRETDEDIFSFLEEGNDTGDDVTDFLEKLTVFTGQPTEDELDDVIKKELVVACGGAVNDAGAIYRIFEGLFKQWWRDSKVVLDETSDILQRAIDQLSSEAELTKQTELCTLELNFNERDLYNDNASFLGGFSLLHITVRPGLSMRVCATRVLRQLQAERLLFTFISLEYLVKHQTTLVADWRDGYKDWLVIVIDCLEKPGKAFLTDLRKQINDVLKKISQKKAIIVSRHDCPLACKIVNYVDENKYKIIDIASLDFSYLDQASQAKIFEKEVIFQDNKFKLESLYEGDLQFWNSLLSDGLVEDLFTTHLILIGPKLPNPIQHFIPRQLKRCTYLNVEILKSEMITDVFAVSGVNVQNLQQLVNSNEKVQTACDHLNSAKSTLSREPDKSRFLVLDSDKAEEEYNALCQNQCGDVHWIHVKEGNMRWVKSNGSIATLKQFTDPNRSTIVQSESVLYSDNRACLLIAEPGMGKSTLVPALAQAAKNANPSHWVICINLRDHLELFNKSQQLSAFEFLTSSMGIDSALERSLLQLSLEQTGNVIIFLDSFDEICPRYKDEGCALLSKILRTAVKKVVVTSRHCVQDILEKYLTTFPYNIMEFSEEDQRMFFIQFWSQFSTPMTHVQLDNFITKLIDSVNSIDPEKRLMGIPLQTMMLAEVFHDYVMDPENNEFPEKLDLLTLFERFVDKKFMIFFRKGNTILNREDSKQKFYEDHMHAALVLLISTKDMNTDQSRTKTSLISQQNIVANAEMFLRNIDEAKDNSGMIISIVNHMPNFIHQMFAEYFAGIWFSENFHSNVDFLRDTLFQPNFNVIRRMLDRILAKGHRLHEAVLEKDMLLVERLLGEEGVDVNSLDGGCRTPLHLAVVTDVDSYENTNFGRHFHERFIGPRSRHMVELLLEQGAAVDVIDAVLKWSPLEYAFKTRSWDAMEFLLGGNADSGGIALSKTCIEDGYILARVFSKRLVNLLALFLDRGLSPNFQTNHDTHDHDSLLHVASQYGHPEFVDLLLSRGADKRGRDAYKNVPLHIAAMYGHLPVVRALLQTRSRFRMPIFLNKFYSFRRYVNSVNTSDQTALHAAMNAEVVSVLISHGANIWIRDYQNRLCLHTACWYGRLSVVQAIIESLGQNRKAKHELINSLDIKRKSPMSLASKYGHSDIVSFLLSEGADVWSRDVNGGRTSLHWAVDARASVAEALLESVGKDKCKLVNFVEATDLQDKSALILALTEEKTDVIRLLVSYGASVSKCDNEGRTSLHYARNSTLAQILIESLGEDKEEVVKYVNIQDREGISALCVASEAGCSDVVELLISHRANVWALDKKGRTSLHYAGNTSVARALIGGLRGDKDQVRKLVNVLDHEGISAMILASKQGRLAVAEILVLHGADVWARDERGRTGLHYPGNTDLTKAILDSFAEDRNEICKFVNTLDNDGMSAMVISSTQRYSDIVEILVSNGADTWARNTLGRTSLHYARSKSVARALIDSLGDSSDDVTKYVNTLDNEGIPALFLASEDGQAEVVQLLIAHGADVRTCNNEGRTSLHYASNGIVAEALIGGVGKDVAEINKYVNALDTDGLSAIILASMKGYADVVRVLGLHGSDVWARDTRGRTSLHHAYKCEVVQALVETLKVNNDDVAKYVNAVDNENESAMHLACLFDYPDVLRLLISYGGDVWAQDKKGRHCLHIAAENAKLSLAKILIESFGKRKKGAIVSLYINVGDKDGVTAWDIAWRRPPGGNLFDMAERTAFAVWLRHTIQEHNIDYLYEATGQNVGERSVKRGCVIQ